jgi:hypothetical protein
LPYDPGSKRRSEPARGGDDGFERWACSVLDVRPARAAAAARTIATGWRSLCRPNRAVRAGWAFGGNAPVWPAPPIAGGRSSAQPADRASGGDRERETDGDSPERAGESWQGVSPSASGFEHAQWASVGNPGARRVAADLASDAASAHVGCFVERAPTPSARGNRKARGALHEPAVRVVEITLTPADPSVGAASVTVWTDPSAIVRSSVLDLTARYPP